MRSFARGRRGATRRPAPPVAAAAAVTQWPLQTLHIDERAAVNHLLALPMTHPCVRRREEPPRCSSAAANETTRISERYRSLTGIIGVLGNRTNVVGGKGVIVRVDIGGSRIIKKKHKTQKRRN